MQIEVVDRRIISEADARSIAELLNKVFTRRSLEDRTARLVDDWPGYRGPEAEYPRSMIIRDGGRVLAHAAATPRTIGTSEGELTIVALSHVATDPEGRGRKLGQAVVRAVFDLVDHGPFLHSLFQTSHQVRPFYEKLGAGVVTNRFVNSLGDDPAKTPFWDEVVMRYPIAKHWPEGEVDLRGPAW